MSNIVIDSWIREAQEATKLIEDTETRVNNKNLERQQFQEHGFSYDIDRSKLLEVGIKLDRLESLLHNPPSKPILTDGDLEYRWKLLSDIKLRTKALALCLYTTPSQNRPRGLPIEDTKDESELLIPLTSDDATRSDMQIKHCGSFSLKSCFWKICRILLLILGSAAFLFILVIICAVI